MQDEHLAVTAAARADADGRDGQFRRDSRGNLGGHAFQDDCEGAGLCDRLGIGPQCILGPLDLVGT